MRRVLYLIFMALFTLSVSTADGKELKVLYWNVQNVKVIILDILEREHKK